MSLLNADCVHSGCRYDTMTRQINHLILENAALRKQARNMDAAHMTTRGFALWCKPGEHPFGDDDMGRKPLSTVDDKGNEVTVMMCSQHLPDYMQPGAKRKVSLKALMEAMDDPTVEVVE